MAPKVDSDPFVLINCHEAPSQSGSSPHIEGSDPMYGTWGEHGSAHRNDPGSFVSRKLREIYPDHAITRFSDINLLGYPGVLVKPLSPPDIISQLYWYPMAREGGQSTGMLINDVKFGSFRVAWEQYDFILYVFKYIYPAWEVSTQFLLHEGPEMPAQILLSMAGGWSNDLHEEVYVFDSGFWSKDHGLWLEIQKANWDDIILKDEFKSTFKKDVFGFFDSKDLYANLGIPWKRGIIMHGPPGNGKTISMKAVMKDCDAKGYYPLYVKSFRSWKGEEGAMADVFEKARQTSPCVVILEDLDSLINERNRSFFLNQLDGLESNDGLLVIGTTNHMDRIDPALSNRPSRFDRKFLFDDPDRIERKLYVQYWQQKLKGNKAIEFPDTFAEEIAETTDRFSFAYLKEVFVSALVILAGFDGKDDKPTFAQVIRGQIKTLRKQLDKKPVDFITHDVALPGGWNQMAAVPEPVRMDARQANQSKIWDLEARAPTRAHMPGEMSSPGGRFGQDVRGERDFKAVANAAARLGRSFVF